MRLCKLHGSLDWRYEGGRLRRVPLAFGSEDPTLAGDALDRLMIYPNAAKDVETLEFPYAELFRDLSAAICRPNGVLLTVGYGFGDDHCRTRTGDPFLTVAVRRYGRSLSRRSKSLHTRRIEWPWQP